MTCPAGANAVSRGGEQQRLRLFGRRSTCRSPSPISRSGVDAGDNAPSRRGRSSRHVVTVAPQSGAYNSEVTLSCASGEPAAADHVRLRSAGGDARGRRRAIHADDHDGGDRGAVTAARRRRVSAGAIDRRSAVRHRASSRRRLTFGTQTDQHDGAGAARVAHQHRRRRAERCRASPPTGDFAAVQQLRNLSRPGASCGCRSALRRRRPARAPARCRLSTMRRAARTPCR